MRTPPSLALPLVLVWALLLLPLRATTETPALSEPALVSVAEQIIDQLSRDDYAPVIARFDAAMRRSFPEARLRTVWQSLQQQVGVFRRRLPARAETTANGTVVHVGCDFRDMELEARIAFNPKGEVASLTFGPKR